MSGFKKEAFINESSLKRGKGSFYGVHLDSKVVIQPETDLPVPPSDLIGPHLNFVGAKPNQK